MKARRTERRWAGIHVVEQPCIPAKTGNVVAGKRTYDRTLPRRAASAAVSDARACLQSLSPNPRSNINMQQVDDTQNRNNAVAADVHRQMSGTMNGSRKGRRPRWRSPLSYSFVTMPLPSASTA